MKNFKEKLIEKLIHIGIVAGAFLVVGGYFFVVIMTILEVIKNIYQ